MQRFLMLVFIVSVIPSAHSQTQTFESFKFTKDAMAYTAFVSKSVSNTTWVFKGHRDVSDPGDSCQMTDDADLFIRFDKSGYRTIDGMSGGTSTVTSVRWTGNGTSRRCAESEQSELNRPHSWGADVSLRIELKDLGAGVGAVVGLSMVRLMPDGTENPYRVSFFSGYSKMRIEHATSGVITILTRQ